MWVCRSLMNLAVPFLWSLPLALLRCQQSQDLTSACLQASSQFLQRFNMESLCIRGFIHYLQGLVSSQIDLQGSTALTQLTLVDMYLATWNLATGISQKGSFVFIFSKKNWHSALPLQQAAPRREVPVYPTWVSPHRIYQTPCRYSTAKSNSVFLFKILVMFLWGTLTIR